MDFENEWENEDEREFEGIEEGIADESGAGASDGIDALDVSLERADEGDAGVDDEGSEAASIEQAPTESAESPQGISVTPSTEAVYINAPSGEFARDEHADGGFVGRETRDAEQEEAPAVSQEERRGASGSDDLGPRAQGMLNPTSDGGPPLARPIIIVRLADDQMEYLINEVLKRSAKRNEHTCRELVQHLINQEFWRRDCQERAIIGH